MQLLDLRVFVSYPRGGRSHSWAEKVHADLAARGAHVWRDERSIAEGDPDWPAAIEEGLRRSDVVACIVGTDTRVCKWQRREILLAESLSKPIVALRVATVEMPFAMLETTPVEVRATEAETLAALATAIIARAPTPTSADPATAGNEIDSAQCHAERVYLDSLVYTAYSDRGEYYTAIAGTERSTSGKLPKNSRIDTDVLAKAFSLDPSERQETRYDDVLDAYRALPGRKVRRLAVLGEPGAGKTFSLERLAFELAEFALSDPTAPIPLLVPLRGWTREQQKLHDYVCEQIGTLGRYLEALRDQRRAFLLLDGMNEIPSGQRELKAEQIKQCANDERYRGVVVSCRERDFQDDFRLPFDTLTLLPLSPVRIQAFLQRYNDAKHGHDRGAELAAQQFWQLAGGPDMQSVWRTWEHAGASFEQFWSAPEIPRSAPNVYNATSHREDELWRQIRFDARGLLRLAANPYLLTILAQLEEPPANRAVLFDGFLQMLYARERKACDDSHRPAPDWPRWIDMLAAMAEAFQRNSEAARADSTVVSMARGNCPQSLTDAMLNFSIDASVLRREGAAISFAHQLLQEYLASRVLLNASRGQHRSAAEFWPAAVWWQRNGWEVVAEIAAESLADDAPALHALIEWLAAANPEVACDAWRRVGEPALPETLAAIAQRWCPRLTDIKSQPQPAARASIGRALGRFGLDRRAGIGLGDGVPDIDWVTIPGDQSFVYQKSERLKLPAFRIARYPVTNLQYQAFIDAGGYADKRWWTKLATRFDAPEPPAWDEPNSPRETVSWYEAIAYCRWLSERLALPVTLPTEHQWERAARGPNGREYPWGNAYRVGAANCRETAEQGAGSDIMRTTAVGLYPHAASFESILDLAGNVWEWCLNEFDEPTHTRITGEKAQALRGGSWFIDPGWCRAARRYVNRPGYRNGFVGFRVCCGSPID